MRRPPAAALLPALALLLAPPAAALDVANIAGHMTDPGHRLSDSAKTSVEDLLGKIAEDTHIDVAGSITGAPEGQADALGNAFYKRWNIGGEPSWDNGVFFSFPATGRVHVILNPTRPELTPEEAAKLAAADDPKEDMEKRIDHLIDVTREIIAPKTQHKARPWGQARPERALYYLIATIAVALAAIALSFRKRRPAAPPPQPTPAPEPKPIAP